LKIGRSVELWDMRKNARVKTLAADFTGYRFAADRDCLYLCYVPFASKVLGALTAAPEHENIRQYEIASGAGRQRSDACCGTRWRQDLAPGDSFAAGEGKRQGKTGRNEERPAGDSGRP